MGQCAWNITVARDVWVYLLHHGHGYLGTSWGQRTITCTNPGGTATTLALRYHLYLVGNGILGALRVRFGSGNFAVAGLVVDELHTGDGDGRCGIRAIGLVKTPFRCIREMLIAGGLGGYTPVRGGLDACEGWFAPTQILCAGVL